MIGSIRGTLVLNLVLLLLGALGAVCILAYETARENVEGRLIASQEILERDFEDRRKEQLRWRAQTLASLTHSQIRPERLRIIQYLAVAGCFSTGISSYPHLQLPLWISEASRGPFPSRLQVALATDINLGEEVLNRDPSWISHEYLQIHSDWGSIWRSKSLGQTYLPSEFNQVDTESGNEYFESIRIDEKAAESIHYKAPLSRIRYAWSPPPRSPFERQALSAIASVLSQRTEPIFGGARPDRNSGNRNLGSLPLPGSTRPIDVAAGSPGLRESAAADLYIQCAWSDDHPKMIELRTQRDEKFANLEAEAHETRTWLKRRLLVIGSVSLLFAMVAGWSIIGIGLRPLNKLGEAVGRVSPSQMKLSVDLDTLPSELKPMAKTIHQTLDLLHLAFEREKRSVADISHELRTPVAALNTTLDVTLRKTRSPEQYRETLVECRVIGKQLGYTVERVMQLARMDSGVDEIQEEETDLREILKGCAAIAKPLAESQNLALKLESNRELPLRSDPNKIREVVMNLVHNAIEYNRPGGTISLRGGVRPEGGVILEVQDTGIGIPISLREKIFERFFRADPARNEAGAHAGLGLAIVREYVERLGGKIDVASQEGIGSTFRVEIPNLNPPPK
jgi:two-component system, OmpR family, heavy metal sensor histidine kinase CusS